MLENNFGRFSGDRADFSDIQVRMPKIARGTGGTGGKSVVEEELRPIPETDLSEGLGEVIAHAGGSTTGFGSFVMNKEGGAPVRTQRDVLPERDVPQSEKIDTKPVTDGERNLYTKAQVEAMIRNAVNIASKGKGVEIGNQPDIQQMIQEGIKKAISELNLGVPSTVKRTADENKVMDKGIPEDGKSKDSDAGLHGEAAQDTPKEERVDSEKDGFGGGDGQSGGDTGKVVDPVGAMPGEKTREAKLKDIGIWEGPEGWNVKATFDNEQEAVSFHQQLLSRAGSKKVATLTRSQQMEIRSLFESAQMDGQDVYGALEYTLNEAVGKGANEEEVKLFLAGEYPEVEEELEKPFWKNGGKKVADDNGPSDADVQAKAYEMFKESWDALSSEQMDEVYKALGVKVEGSTQRAIENGEVVGEDEDPIEEVIRKKEGRMEVENTDYTKGVTADVEKVAAGTIWTDEGKAPLAPKKRGETGNPQGTFDNTVKEETAGLDLKIGDEIIDSSGSRLVVKDLRSDGYLISSEDGQINDIFSDADVENRLMKGTWKKDARSYLVAINEHQARRRALRLARKEKIAKIPRMKGGPMDPQLPPEAYPGEEEDKLIMRDLKNLIKDGFPEQDILDDMVETYSLKPDEAKFYYDQAKTGSKNKFEKGVIQVADSKEVSRQVRDKQKEFQAPKDGVNTVVRPIEKFVGKDTSSKVERAITDRATGDTVFGTDKVDEMKENKRQRRQKRKTGTLIKKSDDPTFDESAIDKMYADDIADISEDDFQAYEDVRASGVTNMWAVDVVEDISGLSRDKIMKIMKEYGELVKLYPNVRKGGKKVAEIVGLKSNEGFPYGRVEVKEALPDGRFLVEIEASGEEIVTSEGIKNNFPRLYSLMKAYGAKKASLAVGDLVSVFSEEEEDYNGQKGEVTEVKPGGVPESVRYMVKMPNGDEVDFGADNVVKVGVDETPDEEIESGAPKVSMRKKERIVALKAELAKLLELANFYDENGLVEEASKLDVVREQRLAQLKKAEEEADKDEDIIETKEAYFTNCQKGNEGWFE